VHASTLPLTVTLAVLAAAVTHATWNALAHRIKDQVLAFGLIGIGSVAVSLPLAALATLPRGGSWPFLLSSVAIHVFYNLLLMRSFTYGDFGQVYPLARGTSPLVVTVLAAIFTAEVPTLTQLAGVLIVSAGMATLVLAGRRPAPRDGAEADQGKPGRAALIAAVGTGLTIAAYTVVDGVGVRRSGSPIGYIAWLMILESLFVPGWAAVRRRQQLLAATRSPAARRTAATGLLAGMLAVLAYGLVLWAQTRGALAPIAALRETSVIFGALIATVAFKEPFGRTRIVASVLVVVGIVVLNLP
jgi:drug/metabolite transporter (DMT)-like permease